MAARVSTPTPFLHVRVLSLSEDRSTVLVRCSHRDCTDYTQGTAVGPYGAESAFKMFNKHLAEVG